MLSTVREPFIIGKACGTLTVIRGIDYDKCNQCGLCYKICPTDVFGVFAGKVYVKYPEDCQGCNLCNVVCAFDACLVDPFRPSTAPQPLYNLETQKGGRK